MDFGSIIDLLFGGTMGSSSSVLLESLKDLFG